MLLGSDFKTLLVILIASSFFPNNEKVWALEIKISESSFDMDNNQKDDITNSLSELVNKKINIDFNVDKKLIGGLKIKVDDTLYDSSLQTKLENAKSKLVGV